MSLINIHKRIVALVTLVALAIGLMFQGSIAGVGAPLRKLKGADAQSWRYFVSTELTPKGDWFAYETATANGAVSVGLRQLDSKEELQYTVGKATDGAGKLALSQSGRYAAFVVAGPSGKEVWVIDLSSGQRTAFKDVDQFFFAPRIDDGDWIAIASKPRESDSSVKLQLRSLTAGASQSFDSVKEFSFNKSGPQIAVSTVDRTFVLALSGDKAEETCGAPQSANVLTWSPQGNLLAGFIKATDRNELRLLVFSNASANCHSEVIAPSNLSGFPAGRELLDWTYFSPLEELDYRWRPLEWRDDETGFFVSIAPADDRVHGENNQNLTLWHSADSMLPTEEHDPKLGRWRPRSLGYVAFRQHTFTQLGGPGITYVVPHPRAQKLLAFDDTPYRRESDLTFHIYRDVYLVDVMTGARTLAVRRLQIPYAPVYPQLSPDGEHLVYLDGPNVVAYDVATGSRRRINQQGDYFQDPHTYDKAESQRRQRVFSQLQGWSSDGCSVLMSDRRNIWALPLCGGGARNLTKTTSNAKFFTLRAFEAPGSQDWLSGEQTEAIDDVDLSQPVYFMFDDQNDRSTGLAAHMPGEANVKILSQDPANIQFLKASRSPRLLVSRESAVTFPDFYVAGLDWKPAMRLTDINPQQRELQWYPGDMLLNYRGAHGTHLQTVLYLPLHYKKGQSYPAIVGVYDERGSGFNYYTPPGVSATAGHSVPFWTSQGYAVMLVDTIPHFGNVGAGILSDVTAGVHAAVRTGIVDRNRLGLEGLSYGGYETEFFATHSNLFKAAVALSSVPDLIEAGRGVLSGRGIPSEGAFDEVYGLVGPWWRDLRGYMRNSPMYATDGLHTPLLLVQGEADGRTPAAAVIGFFNTVREHGNRDVVLLTYTNNAHGLETDEADIMARKQQFYAHYLKGEPAPSWWANGYSLSKGEAMSESPVWTGDQVEATQPDLITK